MYPHRIHYIIVAAYLLVLPAILTAILYKITTLQIHRILCVADVNTLQIHRMLCVADVRQWNSLPRKVLVVLCVLVQIGGMHCFRCVYHFYSTPECIVTTLRMMFAI